MKNKKLFAILTLVCFMFTLMPVAAFAAPVVPEKGAYVVENGTDDDSVTVKATEKLTVAVTGSSLDYFFWAEDADEEVVALGNSTAAKTAVFELDEVGTYYVYAVAAGDGVDDVFKVATSTKAQIIDTVKDRYDNKVVNDPLTVKVKAADTTYKLEAKPAKVTVTANDNWSKDAGKVVVTLLKNTDTPVRNAEIEFSANSGYVNVELIDNATDRSGEQEIKISAAKEGTFKVYADYGDAETLEIDVTVLADDIAVIKTVAEPARGVALDSVFNRGAGLSDVAFEITTADGTVVTGDTTLKAETDYRVTVVEAPADSNIDEEELALNWDADNNRWLLKGNTSLDEEGKYVIKVALKDGNAATATINVVEFDEPIMMNLVYKANTVALLDGPAVDVKAVVFVDKNGTTLSAAHPDYTKYAGATKDGKVYANIDFAATGKAVKDVDAKGTVSTVEYNRDNKDLVGTEITVMAINDKLEMTATAKLTVVDNAAGLKYESTTADIAVNNELIVNTVDEDGNVVAAGLSKDTAKTKVSVYVLDAPKNAAYYVTGDVTDADEVTVNFTASAAGEYKLQTIVRDVVNGKYYSSVDVITVGGAVDTFKDVVVVSLGADKMIVNNELVALDVAPFIENNRTMMQFNVLYVFGIDVQWVAETQSIVAEGNGIKVVMQLGSKVATVNGEEVALDVAPYSLNGRTVVPVGFVTGTFGINPTFTYNVDGTIADIIFAK